MHQQPRPVRRAPSGASEGEMARRLREIDWSSTPLGAMDGWPISLTTAVGICLNSRFPMFVWWGPDLVNIYNDAYIPVLGQRHPGAFGRPARAIWHEIWDVLGPQADAVMLRGQATWNDRVLLLMERNGYPEETYFTWSYSPIPDGRGGVGGLFCACTEDTKAVLTERQRDQLASQRQVALDAARMGWWHFDPRTNVSEWDARYAEIFGVEGRSIDNAEILKRIHPDDLPGLLNAVGAALDPANPTSYATEYRVCRDDGSPRWVEAHGVAEFRGEGPTRKATNFVGTVADITDRKLAEQLLRLSEERLALAVDAGELGTFYCPMPMGEIIWNAKCKEHFWLPPTAEIDFDVFYAILHPDDRERTRKAVETAIFDRRGYDIEYRTVAPDGRQRWLRAKGRAYYDSAGAPTRFDGITLDITEDKRVDLERGLLLESERAARADADRASRMKDEFLATLSHELRTPLNAILGWSQIIKRGTATSADVAQGVEVIERNARAQAQIIEDLLEMSRIISGKLRLELGLIDLSDLLREACDTARPAAEAKGVHIACDRIEAMQIKGDSNRLQQVLWNLLTNAIKFTPRGGSVDVRLTQKDAFAKLQITDTGEGIRAEFLPFIFERFRQADASTTRRFGGLGLGLSIVKQLVELHGGTVQAASAGQGQGATFIVTLPLASAGTQSASVDADSALTAVAQVSTPGRPTSNGSLAGLRVLVVDDDADARMLAQRLLEENEATVITAASAEEAIGLLAREPFNMLVSDIGMPGEDGHTLIGRVRSLPGEATCRIPALALTAYAREDDRKKALSAGFDRHLAKPINPSELIAVVEDLAGRR